MSEIKYQHGVTKDSLAQEVMTRAFAEVDKAFPNGEGLTYETAVRFFEQHKDEYVIWAPAKDSEKVKKIVKNHAPEAVVSSSEAKKRREVQEEYAKNLWKSTLEYSLTHKLYPLTDRTVKSFIIPSLSPEENMKNKEFYDTIKLPMDAEGREEKVKAAYMRRLEDYANTDISAFDFTNDEVFAKNYGEFLKARSAFDLQNVVKAAGNHVDFTDPALAKFCKKATDMNTVWACAGTTQNYLSSTMYAEIDPHKVSIEAANEITMEAGSLEPSEIISLSSTSFESFHAPIYDKTIPTVEARLDKMKETLPDFENLNRNSVEAETNRRLAYKTMSPQQKAQADKVRISTEDTPDRFFGKAISKSLDSLKKEYGFYNEYAKINPEGAPAKQTNFNSFYHSSSSKAFIANILAAYSMQVEYTQMLSRGKLDDPIKSYALFKESNLASKGNQLAKDPAFIKAVNDMTEADYKEFCLGREDVYHKFITEKIPAAKRELNAELDADPKAYFRSKIIENMEILKSVNPNFTYTEADVDAMLTEERFNMRAAAKEKKSQYEKRSAFSVENLTGENRSEFARCVAHSLDASGTPEADAANKAFLDKINSPSAEGDAARKQFFVDIINRANTLNPDDYKPGKTRRELFNNAMRDYDNGYLAWALGDLTASSGSMDYGLTPEALARFNDQKVKLTGLGAVCDTVINEYADDKNFAIPYDMIDAETFALLMASKDPKAKALGMNVAYDMNNKIEMNGLEAEGQFSGKTYNVNEMTNLIPDSERCVDNIEDLSAKITGLYTELKNAKSNISWLDSNEYTAMLEALGEASETLGNVKGIMDEETANKVYNSVKKVSQTATAYETAKRKQDKNETRQKRYDIAVKCQNLTKRLVKDSGQYDNAYRDPQFLKFAKTSNDFHFREAGLDPEKYFGSVRTGADAATRSKEEMFEAGLRITDKISRKAAEASADSVEKILCEKIAEARNELANQIGRTGEAFNKEKVIEGIGTIVCCQAMLDGEIPTGIPKTAIEKSVKAVCGDVRLTNMLGDMDSDKLNEFLGSEKAVTDFTKKYEQAIKAPSKEDAKELTVKTVGGKNSVSHAENEQPGLGSPQLGGI